MAFTAMSSSLFYSTVSLLLLGAKPVYGSTIASWWVDTDAGYSPQLFHYNETTGKIYGSLCNSLTTPVFAQNDSTALQTTISPLAGTNIASLGYLSDDILQANVFYLADLDGVGTTIVSASYACDNSTGVWEPSGSSYNEYVSNGTNCAETAPTISTNSGLSALYLSSDDGMRVFFKTAEFQTHYLQYLSSGSCTGWSYVGIASNLTTGNEVTSGFLASKPAVWTIAQTVFINESATADTSGEIEISTSNARGVADLWSINRMPTQIIGELKSDNSTEGILTNMSTTADSEWTYEHTDSWGFTFSSYSGSAARIGLSTDSGGLPSVFYIGTDGYLRRFAADTQGHWHEDDSEDDSKWPAADTASADFGIAYDSPNNRIWMYYLSDGTMTQVYQSGTDSWQSFTRLSTLNTTSSGTTGSSSGSGSSSSGSGTGSDATTSSSSTTTGLSSDAKVGLGIGVGLGIPLIALAAGLFYIINRRKQARLAKRDQLETLPTGHGHNTEVNSPATINTTTTLAESAGPDQNQGYWQDGMWIEKSATTYYAGGPGANHMPREQLGELPTRSPIPVYEMSANTVAHEMPVEPDHRV